MYTKKKWLWAGLLSIATGLFANIVWIIPTNRNSIHNARIEHFNNIICLMFSQRHPHRGTDHDTVYFD